MGIVIGEEVKVINPKNKLYGSTGVVMSIDSDMCIVRFDKYIGGDIEDGYGYLFLPSEVSGMNYHEVIPNVQEMRVLVMEDAQRQYTEVIKEISAKIRSHAREGINRVILDDISFNYFENGSIPDVIKFIFTKTSGGQYKWTTEYVKNKQYDVIYYDFN